MANNCQLPSPRGGSRILQLFRVNIASHAVAFLLVAHAVGELQIVDVVRRSTTRNWHDFVNFWSKWVILRQTFVHRPATDCAGVIHGKDTPSKSVPKLWVNLAWVAFEIGDFISHTILF